MTGGAHRVWPLALLLPGCLSELLEAPYVLSTGLGEARALSPSGRTTMLVASSTGLWEVDGEGASAQLLADDCSAVTAGPTAVYALCDGGIRWGALPGRGEQVSGWATRVMPGVRDLTAWCDQDVLIGDAASVTAWDPATDETSLWADGLPGLRSLSLGGGGGCDWLTVVTGDAVLAVTPTGKQTLAEGLVAPRAAAVDSRGRLWVVAGEPPSLSRVDGTQPTEFARFLGDARDLQLGLGGLLPPSNGYLADGAGSLDYVHTP